MTIKTQITQLTAIRDELAAQLNATPMTTDASHIITALGNVNVAIADLNRAERQAQITQLTAMVNVLVTGEGGDFMIQVTPGQVSHLKTLLAEYADSGDWHDDINTIIDNAPRIKTVGSINTSGDGGGWYDND